MKLCLHIVPSQCLVAEESVTGFLQTVHSAANGSTVVSTSTKVVNNFLHTIEFKNYNQNIYNESFFDRKKLPLVTNIGGNFFAFDK